MFNKLFLVAFCCFSLGLGAMQRVSTVDRQELANRVHQIEFINGAQGESYFAGREQQRRAYLQEQIHVIEGILNKYDIKHPREKTIEWLDELERSVQSDISQAAQVDSNKCDITGLDKKEVLRALFNAAHVNMSSFRYAMAALSELTEADLERALSGDCRVEYLKGKPLKVDLSGNTVDVRLFNRDNGSGAGQRAIAALKR